MQRKKSRVQKIRIAYKTAKGTMFTGRVEDALCRRPLTHLKGRVNLVFTSPPFPLVRKKKYGNKNGEEYLKWLSKLAPQLAALLTDDGSIVIEVGNAWDQGSPTMSTLPLKALLAFQEKGKLKLCQHVICHNPARLPSPAEWVNVRRIRLKDSYTHVWWMAKRAFPKADNRRVLLPYGSDMRKLLDRKEYNSGERPSGHVISEKGFLKNHGGAIAPNVVDLDSDHPKIPTDLMKLANTGWDANYVAYCKKLGIAPHPARMHVELAGFFIKFLTEPNDLVLDPFAGSNTTGAAAQALGRRWISVEAESTYARASKGRFVKARKQKLRVGKKKSRTSTTQKRATRKTTKQLRAPGRQARKQRQLKLAVLEGRAT